MAIVIDRMLLVEAGEFRITTRRDGRASTFGGQMKGLDGLITLSLRFEHETEVFPVRVNRGIRIAQVDRNSASQGRFGVRAVADCKEKRSEVRCRPGDFRALRARFAFALGNGFRIYRRETGGFGP